MLCCCGGDASPEASYRNMGEPPASAVQTDNIGPSIVLSSIDPDLIGTHLDPERVQALINGDEGPIIGVVQIHQRPS